MGFSVKKRDMHKLALLSQKIHTKKWDSNVFDIKYRDGWLESM